MAYGIKALIDQRIEAGEAAPPADGRRRRPQPRRPRRPTRVTPRPPRPTPPRATDRNTEQERSGTQKRSRPETQRSVAVRARSAEQEDKESENHEMATMSTDELLDVFKNMTVLELNDFLKKFEEEFDVTAAAPVAVAAGGTGCRWRRGRSRRGEGRVRRRPRGGRRQEDPGHQGGPGAHEPRAEGGQGARRQRPEAGAREGVQGGRREGEGGPRGRRRHGRAQVAPFQRRGASRRGLGCEVRAERPKSRSLTFRGRICILPRSVRRPPRKGCDCLAACACAGVLCAV